MHWFYFFTHEYLPFHISCIYWTTTDLAHKRRLLILKSWLSAYGGHVWIYDNMTYIRCLVNGAPVWRHWALHSCYLQSHVLVCRSVLLVTTFTWVLCCTLSPVLMYLHITFCFALLPDRRRLYFLLDDVWQLALTPTKYKILIIIIMYNMLMLHCF